MRRRTGRPTIRGRIVTLTVIPVIALISLWTFAMVSVTGDLRALIRIEDVYETFGTPVDTAVAQLQTERRVSAAYLGAGPNVTPSAAEVVRQQRATDRAVRAMREAIEDGDRADLSDGERGALDAMARSADGLQALRAKVMARTITWDRAVEEYAAMVDPAFDVRSALTALQTGRLAREAQVVVELVRLGEFVSRQDALVAGARSSGRLTDRQYDTLTATIEDRRVFHRTYVPDLPGDSRKLFTDFERGEEYRALVEQEDALLRAGAVGAGRAMAADSWRDTTDRAVRRYTLLSTRSAQNAADRGGAFAHRETVRASVVGVAGLIAVGLSIWFTVAGGRRFFRHWEALRDAADLLAGRRLPEVMERLGAGEEVDAAEAAPPLAFDDRSVPDEIVRVGQALNSARRAAVEAAVQQAALRRGVFTVLLNIARRHQALVHRQSKLVDTLERRTSDPDTLEALFRIDHLTTRMRRHAEGLIVLSGAPPGRRRRNPVPIADIVSAAVGEIEDRTRVVVPPMPPVGIGAEAVADVVHLVAELVENATVYSPPHTQVVLRTGRVGNGFVLEIDDRGLGLDGEELKQARRTLARPRDFDPARDERLGLYVVGRLAERHGIGVTLTRSPYGGTTAVVLLPNSVIAAVDPQERYTGADALAGAGAGARAGAGPGAGPGAGLGPGPGLGTESGAGSRGRPGPVRRAAGGSAQDHGPDPEDRLRPMRPVPFPRTLTSVPLKDDHTPEEAMPRDDASAPASPSGPAQPPPAEPAPTAADAADVRPLRVLPTRVRQASLAPPLREAPASGPEDRERDVSAEEVRSIFGSFQEGLDRGRRGVRLGETPRPNGAVPRPRGMDEGTDDDG